MKQALRGFLFAATALLVCAPAAWSAFPGQNGRIAWSDDSPTNGLEQICTAVPGVHLDCDAAGPSVGDLNSDPAWSSDGAQIAFSAFWEDGEIAVGNADGSGGTLLTTTGGEGDTEPAWAPGDAYLTFTRESGAAREIYAMNPDGTSAVNLTNHPADDVAAEPGPTGRIAFASNRGGNYDIYTMDPDGDSIEQLTHNAAFEGDPDWSPDGSKIAFTSQRDGQREIYVMDADGGDEIRLTTTPSNSEVEPAWSPDGTQIAFAELSCTFCDDGFIGKVNADGGGWQVLFGPQSEAGIGSGPDWQPLPVNTPSTYARPKSANPVQVSLVPAFNACTTPNREHGPPLAFGSCAPPAPGSSHLMVGVGDGHPAPARSAGFARLRVSPGVPGGVDDTTGRLRVSLTNVMRASDLSEYTGELRGSVRVRITDKEGAVGQTVQDLPLELTVPCVPTDPPGVASVCDLGTDLDAILPGATPEGTRAIWQLDQVKVYDGGADEDADTGGDNELFAVQGVFVP